MGKRRHRIERGVAEQLLPSNRREPHTQFAEDAGALEHFRKPAGTRGITPVDLAEFDYAVGAMEHLAGFDHLGSDPRVAAHHGILAEYLTDAPRSRLRSEESGPRRPH